MLEKDVDEKKLEAGEYCRKGSPGCFCKVGYPIERTCPECRDMWEPGDFIDSYCVCGPDDDICPPGLRETAENILASLKDEDKWESLTCKVKKVNNELYFKEIVIK